MSNLTPPPPPPPQKKNASFIFICFHLQLAFHHLYNLFCFVKIELQLTLKNKSSNTHFCQKKLQHLHGFTYPAEQM